MSIREGNVGTRGRAVRGLLKVSDIATMNGESDLTTIPSPVTVDASAEVFAVNSTSRLTRERKRPSTELHDVGSRKSLIKSLVNAYATFPYSLTSRSVPGPNEGPVARGWP